MEPKWTTEDVLVRETEDIGSLDTLTERALATLTARLWDTCCWPDGVAFQWEIGEFAFLIVEFCPAPDTCLYIQFWSEPADAVLMEISSGNSNPGALRYVWHEQRRALEERGFTIGGKAKNFQKTLPITCADAAEQVARETLAILFDVFHYRGACPLVAKVRHGRRAQDAPVYGALEPEDFVQIAAAAGFEAALVKFSSEENRLPLIGLRRRAFRGTASLGSQIPGTALFRTATLTDDADGRSATELVFEGGVTQAWIENSLRRWRAERRRRSPRRTKGDPRRSASQTRGASVH